jgi:hypothetical protein
MPGNRREGVCAGVPNGAYTGVPTMVRTEVIMSQRSVRVSQMWAHVRAGARLAYRSVRARFFRRDFSKSFLIFSFSPSPSFPLSPSPSFPLSSLSLSLFLSSPLVPFLP